jgi:hypothetical protein
LLFERVYIKLGNEYYVSSGKHPFSKYQLFISCFQPLKYFFDFFFPKIFA